MRSTLVLLVSVIAAVGVVAAAIAFKPEEKVNLPVVIEEYADFSCTHCLNFHAASVKLRDKYKDSKDVKYEFKVHAILGPASEQAAFAAEAAKEQGKFIEYSDLLFENFEARTDEDFEKFAQELELDLEKFNQDRENKDLQQRVLDRVESYRQAGITSTPTIIINDKRQNTRDYDELVKLIDDYVSKGKSQQSKK